MTTPANLDELEALAKEATPGPWAVVVPPWRSTDDMPWIVRGSGDPHGAERICDLAIQNDDEDGGGYNAEADARLIAALRTSWPALRDELTALRESLAKSETRVKYLEERERYFSDLLQIPDAGRFRADWDSRLLGLVDENARLRSSAASAEGARRALREARYVLRNYERTDTGHANTDVLNAIDEIDAALLSPSYPPASRTSEEGRARCEVCGTDQPRANLMLACRDGNDCVAALTPPAAQPPADAGKEK